MRPDSPPHNFRLVVKLQVLLYTRCTERVHGDTPLYSFEMPSLLILITATSCWGENMWCKQEQHLILLKYFVIREIIAITASCQHQTLR